jgi:hypothetical protein
MYEYIIHGHLLWIKKQTGAWNILDNPSGMYTFKYLQKQVVCHYMYSDRRTDVLTVLNLEIMLACLIVLLPLRNKQTWLYFNIVFSGAQPRQFVWKQRFGD